MDDIRNVGKQEDEPKGLHLSVSPLDSKHILTTSQELVPQNGCTQTKLFVPIVTSPRQAKRNNKTVKWKSIT